MIAEAPILRKGALTIIFSNSALKPVDVCLACHLVFLLALAVLLGNVEATISVIMKFFHGISSCSPCSKSTWQLHEIGSNSNYDLDKNILALKIFKNLRTIVFSI